MLKQILTNVDYIGQFVENHVSSVQLGRCVRALKCELSLHLTFQQMAFTVNLTSIRNHISYHN